MKIYRDLFLIKNSCSIIKRTETLRCFLNLLLIVIAFLSLVPVTHSQNEVGHIHGKLTDKKLGKPIPNHPVTLNIHKAEDVTQQETKTDENGVYRFEDLPIDLETHYIISTTYDGVAYTEKDLVLSSFVPNLSVNIDIGLTDDPSQLQVKIHTIVIGLPPRDHAPDGALTVIEALGIENMSNSPFQTVVGKETVGLNLDLPEGYEGFHPHAPMSLRRSSTGKQIILTDPLPPGSTDIGYTYIHHVNMNELNLSRQLRFHTNQISILVQEGINLVPHSEHFKSMPHGAMRHEVINNVIYHVYPASPEKGFSAGKKVDLRLGIPNLVPDIRQTGPDTRQMALIAIAAALAGGFLVAAIFMLRGAKRVSEESDDAQPTTTDTGWLRKLSDADLDHARTARLEFITLLDEVHEKQDISERVYNRLRKEQTERLTEILDQRKERGLDN